MKKEILKSIITSEEFNSFTDKTKVEYYKDFFDQLLEKDKLVQALEEETNLNVIYDGTGYTTCRFEPLVGDKYEEADTKNFFIKLIANINSMTYMCVYTASINITEKFSHPIAGERVGFFVEFINSIKAKNEYCKTVIIANSIYNANKTEASDNEIKNFVEKYNISIVKMNHQHSKKIITDEYVIEGSRNLTFTSSESYESVTIINSSENAEAELIQTICNIENCKKYSPK